MSMSVGSGENAVAWQKQETASSRRYLVRSISTNQIGRSGGRIGIALNKHKY
jgi:hypothetical protein